MPLSLKNRHAVDQYSHEGHDLHTHLAFPLIRKENILIQKTKMKRSITCVYFRTNVYTNQKALTEQNEFQGILIKFTFQKEYDWLSSTVTTVKKVIQLHLATNAKQNLH